MKTVTLYYYEYCDSELGIWSREWDTDKRDLARKRKRRAKDMGTDLDSESEQDGSYGDMTEILEATVTLSLTGVLEFANEYALGGE